MQLVLDRVGQHAGGQPQLYPISLALMPGALTVLLGATRAGKTTLLRIMAGLDAPSHGRVLVDGRDVTGVPVRERNVAMVYQQFINYPSMTVAENIAAPLRRQATAGLSGTALERDIDERVRAVAQRLRIEPFLDRLPAQLSGGQQQRVALARALAKRAPLVLLDEPLVNLDYKLREELRDELTRLFATGESTVVYATTDPAEALLLGGHAAVLDRGELLQYGPAADVFHAPRALRVAQAFSDPPMNLLPATLSATTVTLRDGTQWPLARDAQRDSALADGRTGTVGLRAGALRLERRDDHDDDRERSGGHRDVAIAGTVALADIAGSDTFLHVNSALGSIVAQLSGVRVLDLGSPATLYFDPSQLYLFDDAGALLRAPARRVRP